MKGVILAGGTGSRLWPLTKVVNKHLLPVGRHAMIEFALYKCKEAGVEDILVITGQQDAGAIIGLLGGGEGYRVSLTYRVQDRPGGIAHAMALAESFAGGEPLLVLLGDNVFEDSLAESVATFEQEKVSAKLFLKEVDDASRFGVPVLHEGVLTWIEEKPQVPKSSYAVTGIYMYDASVFDIIRRMRPSVRGELEITDVNNALLQQSTVMYEVLHGWWTDAGTFESLWNANQLARDVNFQ